ncbi:lipid A biosynthesis acyltransferase [Hydrogenophaga sp. 5NK40-0174]|uniref:lysophospholipid acyltransferase family protein n=1 Tax=Hydrogenophaga sp. 5NK40-0174 TaxID=3127649 RepID=UPI00310202D1
MSQHVAPDEAYKRRSHLGSRLGVWLMQALSGLPLPMLRAMGLVLGILAYGLAARRRHIASTNWALCFPDQSAAQRRRAIRRHFIYFTQAWLDRSWLWQGKADLVRSRLTFVDQAGVLEGHQPAVLFAPHFVGMDAGWIALTAHGKRRFCGMYAKQPNPDVDHWMAQGRRRFGDPHIVAKKAGLKPLVSAVRAGEPLYVLPDMDYGRRDSIFVPFFGHLAATVPSLTRFAKMGRAPVVPVVARMTPQGYEVTALPAWPDVPGDEVSVDTALMNRRLEEYIRQMPEQYYWVHKRFKTRPAGESSPYDRA